MTLSTYPEKAIQPSIFLNPLPAVQSRIDRKGGFECSTGDPNACPPATQSSLWRHNPGNYI
jgi:hypothetical protein